MTDKKKLQELADIVLDLAAKSNKPRLMQLDTVNISGPGISQKETTITVCSSCFSIIDHPWNHSDWCQLYEAEPLSDWIEKGKNSK